MIIDDNMVNLGLILDLGCGKNITNLGIISRVDELKSISENIDGVDLSKFIIKE